MKKVLVTVDVEIVVSHFKEILSEATYNSLNDYDLTNEDEFR